MFHFNKQKDEITKNLYLKYVKGFNGFKWLLQNRVYSSLIKIGVCSFLFFEIKRKKE